ncbi:ATP-dependent DNA helicase PIF1 [Glycine soja]
MSDFIASYILRATKDGSSIPPGFVNNNYIYLADVGSTNEKGLDLKQRRWDSNAVAARKQNMEARSEGTTTEKSRGVKNLMRGMYTLKNKCDYRNVRRQGYCAAASSEKNVFLRLPLRCCRRTEYEAIKSLAVIRYDNGTRTCGARLGPVPILSGKPKLIGIELGFYKHVKSEARRGKPNPIGGGNGVSIFVQLFFPDCSCLPLFAKPKRKGTWKIVVRITYLWQTRKQNSKQTIEMVLMDQTGSKIGATLWQELFTKLQDKLQCVWFFVFYFLKTTSVKEIHRPEIPSNIYLITPFTDIISSLAPRHTLVDIVGVVADLIDVKTVNPPHRMTVRLRDNSNCDILITVWEDYAIQLHDAIDKNLLLQEPLVVMLTLGKIKDATDKYPLSVQNIKFGSKLYVNADITEIHEFRQSLSVPFYSGGIIHDKDGSQSQSSQSNVVEKFLQNAQVVSIVDEIIIDALWSYDNCPNCTTTFDPSKGGSACRSCHTSVIDTVPRYKLNVRMEHNGDKENFLLWNTTCIKLFGKTAGECRDELIAAGDDIKVFPTCVDEILSKTWAVRFKFRSQLRQSSVLDVSEELHHIQSLIATLGLKGKGIAVEPESSPPIFVPTSSDYDPGNSTCLTPTKRISCQQTSSDFDSDEHTQYQLSTNKHIKADQLLQKSNYSWTYMLNEGSVVKLFYKNEKDSVQLLMCISQCSPTINHNNNPATSFQCTPPSHRTLSMNDSGHCSKRHTVNVSSIQRNLMSSYDNQKNITIACTSTCQASNPYSNMTQSDINRDEHQTPTNTTQDDQFVGDDSSDSTDNDVVLTLILEILILKLRISNSTYGYIMFAFTSPGIKFDKSYNTGKAPPTFRIHGQTHNLIGSLLPMPNNPPKFAQLYIYDIDKEIINTLSQNPMHDMLDEQIIIAIKDMLDHHNHYAQKFRMARDKLHSTAVPDLKMKLISQRQTDGRLYNLPTTTEVAALIVGDEHSADKRDIIIEKQSGLLKRINELHPAYLPLQYPLLYPKGEDGYRLNIPHKDHANIHTAKRKQVTLRKYFCYRLQSRTNEAQTILHSRRLFQQWIVDGYCMIDINNNSVDKYINLTDSNDHPETLGRDRGKKIILPSSFVGSQRYMEQLYFDGMAICGHLGFPDLFLTMTCNPTWSEIQRKVTQSNLTPNNCLDIITRVFKIKLNQLMNDLKHGNIFGNIIGCIRLTEKETIHLCLTEIENMLQANRRSLRDFSSMPYPIGYARNQQHNNLIHNEMAYDKEMLVEQYNTAYQLLTDEQKTIVDTIMRVVNTQSAAVYFMDMVELAKHLFGQPYHLVYAPMVELFVQLLQVELLHYSCLVVGPHIPNFLVPATQNSTCNIHQGSELDELLKVTKLIVWDEALIINMSPSESPWPFKLIRRQFPFIVSYAITINNSQGQSLHHIGLYLPHPVFSHGQLYVALSRVKSKDGLHILIHDNDGNPKNITTNVVYDEFPRDAMDNIRFTTPFRVQKNLLQVPFSYHKQWLRNYPKYVLFHCDGEIHFIRVRTHGTKCFFADGLNDFRKAHNLNESVILCFVVADKNTTFTVHIDGPTHHHSSLKPIIYRRRYIFTADITHDMLQQNLPLVRYTTLFSIYDTASKFVYGSKKKYYHPPRTSKIHPMTTQHPQ